MAFRATKKPSTKKTVSSDTPIFQADTPNMEPSVAVEAPVVSLDELIGGSKKANVPFPPVEQTPDDLPDLAAEAPVDKFVGGPVNNQSMPPAQAQYNNNNQQNNQGNNQGGDFRPRRYDNNRGGYGQNRGGYGQNRGGYGGNRGGYGNRGGQNMGPRRDFGGGGYNRGGFRDQRPYDNQQMSNSFTQDIDVATETVQGILDVMPEGHGFLRPKFTPSDKDVYISQSQIRRFLLRNGDMVQGQARAPKDNERYYGLLKVEKINTVEAESMAQRPRFEDLTPIYPNVNLKVETGDKPLSTRIIDLLAPIGFGQRGLIVSPPKAGKTTMLKELATGITTNFPHVHLMAALIGERPEEVTDLSRSIQGEVLASNFDQSPLEQTRVAEVALDRAKRLVEMGYDVVVLLDSITRLARAYNLVVNPSGRTLSGGFDPAALYPAKKFLGAARCVEPFVIPQLSQQVTQTPVDPANPVKVAAVLPTPERYTTGGSLTVIGTALVDTGSRMDDLIYEEFKGTGNMELHLSRQLQERRVFPAIDCEKSGTRHDELLIGEENMKRIVTLRHMLSMLSNEERTAMLIERLGKTKSNEEFLQSLSQGGV